MDHRLTQVITARNSSCSNVMFLQACVCSQSGGYPWSQALSMEWVVGVHVGVGMAGPRSLSGGDGYP